MPRLYNFLHRNAVFPILMQIWGMAVISWVIFRVFGSTPPDIPSGTAMAFGTVIGLLSVVVGVWQWRVSLDAKKSDKQ
jgi:hypothetical protein